MGRRGQLTIFLAAGVVVLFAFAFLFILSSQINNNSILAVNENVPPPLLSYVENTLEDAARSAVIETIAPQSGYQDPTSAKNQQPTQFYGKELEMNFESEDVRYQTLEEYPYPEYPYTMPPEAPPHPVAYYYLLGKFNIPSLERIQKELLAETEKRFNENLDLSPFEGQYYRLVYPDQEPVINLSINFEDITVDLYYPLEVVTENQRSRLPNMTVNLPLRLNRSYELANCLVNRVVFDEGRDTYDPLDEAPDGDAFLECKAELGLDDYFTTRTVPVRGVLDGEFKGRLVGINDTKNQEDTGVAFEFQYLIWKCSGNFFKENTAEQIADEQEMRVCEYACAKEIPEAVALGTAEVESRNNHYCPIPTVKSAEPVPKPAQGIMGVLKRYCPGEGVGDDGSFIDGRELDGTDLEDNIECGMEIILDKLGGWPYTNNRYCCPSALGGPGAAVMSGPGEHICCQPGMENHECCTNPYDLCCGFPENHAIFKHCGHIACNVQVGYDGYGRPMYDFKVHDSCPYDYKSTCCDPETDPGEDSQNNAYGGCCEPKFGLPPNDPYGTTYGDKPPEPVWPIDHPLPWYKLTKDATYDSWDLAIRGYYGWLCDDPTHSAGIGPVTVQNYLELVHGRMRFGDDAPQMSCDSEPVHSRFLYNAYPTDPKYSLCHSYGRPPPEVSSTETGLTPTWPSDYIGLMDEPLIGVNSYGCCCQEDSDLRCWDPWRLDGS